MSKQASKKQKTSRIFIILVVAVALLAIAGMLVFHHMLGKGMEPCDPGNTSKTEVVIPVGSSTASIAAILKEAGLINSEQVFKIQSKLQGVDGKYKAGAYEISPSMSMGEIMELLAAGRDSTLRFTIPEGYTLDQIAERLSEQNLIDKEVFWELAESGEFDYWFLKDAPAGKNRLEGYLYPETYEVFNNASERDIIEKMLTQFGKVFNEDMEKQAKKLGYDINEILTVASMIERETLADSERNLVASVIYNRLDKGMRLGIDATVQYALGEQKQYLSSADTKIDSPYNTYRIDGLPPGPICSPSASSIKAALNPADTKYLYYVLKPDNTGCHNFSSGYDQFLKDKAAYKNYHNLQ